MAATLDRNCLWFSQFLPWLSVTTRRETWQKHEKLSNRHTELQGLNMSNIIIATIGRGLALTSQHWADIGSILQIWEDHKNHRLSRVCWTLPASSWETLLVNLNILRWLLIMKYLERLQFEMKSLSFNFLLKYFAPILGNL